LQSRPEFQDQDQDCKKSVSSGLEDYKTGGLTEWMFRIPLDREQVTLETLFPAPSKPSKPTVQDPRRIKEQSSHLRTSLSRSLKVPTTVTGYRFTGLTSLNITLMISDSITSYF